MRVIIPELLQNFMNFAFKILSFFFLNSNNSLIFSNSTSVISFKITATKPYPRASRNQIKIYESCNY